MSHFLPSGHLRFCVKAIPSVDLEIGIRSDNIYPGYEQSKVMLSAYGIQAGSTWQNVAIPLSHFAELDDRLDFSKMEVYFVVSVVGSKIGGAASGKHWIDYVRWTKD
jgi:hypothetical protein